MWQTGSPTRVVTAFVVAGVCVGILDALWAVWPLSLSARGVLSTTALAMAVDGLLAGAVGLVLHRALRIREWGKATSVLWARLVALLITSAVAGAAGVLAVQITATRVNRFLAAGVVLDVMLAFWLLVALFTPALARVLSWRWHRRQPAAGVEALRLPNSVVGWWWAAPAVLLVAGAAAFVVVWRTRAPLRGAALLERSAWIFVIGLILPFLLHQAVRVGRGLRMPAWLVRALPVLLASGAAAVVMAMRWQNDFQYLPLARHRRRRLGPHHWRCAVASHQDRIAMGMGAVVGVCADPALGVFRRSGAQVAFSSRRCGWSLVGHCAEGVRR